MRVSRMLEACGLVDPWWFTAAARERGTTVHLIGESALRGWTIEVSDEYVGYREQLALALAALPFQPVLIEKRLHAFGMSGRPDAVGFLRESVGRWPPWPTILDFKSGNPLPSHAVQLSLYELLCGADPAVAHAMPPKLRGVPWLRIGLYVQPDRYQLKRYDALTDRQIAKAVVDVVNWRQANGLISDPDTTAGSEQPDDPAVPF